MSIRTLTALLALSLGSALATQYPLTVTDDLGRRVTLNSEPKRIVAMLPSHTETLVALGVGNHLVGIDRFSNYPREVTDKIPKVGSGFQPNIEAIVALKPDLVLADESASSRLTEKLEKAGLTVYGGTAQTYNEVFEKISTIGKLVNREPQALNLITSLRRDLNEVQNLVRGAPKVSVYYEVDPSGYTAGPNSFIGSLLDKAGGRNVIPANLGDFPKISPELVVSASPSVIINAKAEDVAKRPGWNTIAAVKNGKVYQPTSEEIDALSRPGPRLAVALRVLAKLLHPERF
ncbi:ABC transporter substrate-binding protein [Deinococcus peraridilitoris]|uniref:ABC-type Fe3+-hydroxamate transport system, periplasmic component n=1 Tax=Deinococcus peraridilitoris (strain DSM 19664 / LMG 22246 / CIP 109416 / KR-200) TaxID=937777 RepID=L0A1L0_DEIPD|nr:ABC transporter substrate-binding protein [Deinococcus peraridilitoris]AFZ67783.1 ABC-type Fe3+-hydroxamate transport system, periplasmic component [Deinococcus peraridilitoris DSM 19664]